MKNKTKIIICKRCLGTGKELVNTRDFSLHPSDQVGGYEYLTCSICKGTGRLLKRITYEVINEKSST